MSGGDGDRAQVIRISFHLDYTHFSMADWFAFCSTVSALLIAVCVLMEWAIVELERIYDTTGTETADRELPDWVDWCYRRSVGIRNTLYVPLGVFGLLSLVALIW